MKKMIAYLLVGLLTVNALPSKASEFMMQFTVTGFVNRSRQHFPAPNDPLSGTIFYQATDIHAPVQTINAINLEIDGHRYSVGEIGYRLGGGGSVSYLGGLANAVSGLTIATDDFWIAWETASLLPLEFSFVTRLHGFYEIPPPFTGAGFTYFAITSVPEPKTPALLLISAVILLVFPGKRFHKKNSEAKALTLAGRHG